MLGRRRREDDDQPTRLQDLCCEEERMLDGWADEGLDPMRAAATEARLEQACERLDQRRSKPPRSPL
jgi:hypothetical protein